MAADDHKPTVVLTVSNADGEAMKAALIAEGIDVSEVATQPVSGIFFVIPFLAGALLAGGTYDVEKFVIERGAKGVKQLVKSLQKQSGAPDAKGTVLLEDEKKTRVVLPSDLPGAAYEALERLNLGKLAGLTIDWHDPPGEWRVDMPVKITPAGDGSF